MKYIISSVLLLAFLLAFCLFSAVHVSGAVEETTAYLHRAMELQEAGRRRDAIEMVRHASRCWKRHQVYFGTVLRHEEVDNVLGEFARLESYAQTNDQDDFLSNCAALLAELSHIGEMEWPYLHNIL